MFDEIKVQEIHSSSTSVMCPGKDQFESCLRHWLSSLRTLMVIISLTRQMPEQKLKLPVTASFHVLPNPPFTLIQSFDAI
jgi:hypothetical protein